MLLSLEGVDVHYGHAKVLHEINLHILKGEVAFIVGRNGAGKTTLANLIAGILKPCRGDILMNGVGKPNGNLARRVGLLFQNPSR